MGNFAKITDGKITDVIVASQEFVDNLLDSSDWIEKTLDIAGIGWNYDIPSTTFYPPQPFDSWILDTGSFTWDAPVPYPTGSITGSYTGSYIWDESVLNWDEAPSII